MVRCLSIWMLVLLGHIMMRADYLYMGGGYDFTPLGTADRVLTLRNGQKALMSVTPTTSGTMLMTSLITSPLDKSANAGIGFILIGPRDTTRLVIAHDNTTDPLYADRVLTLTQITDGKPDKTFPPISADMPCLHESPSLFTLGIEGNRLTVACGRSGTVLWQTDMPVPSEVGYFAPGNSQIVVKRAMLITDDAEPSALPLSIEEISQRLSGCNDPYSGYWTLLDNTFDTAYLRPGGDYTFALLPDAPGYRLLYLDGATVSPDGWSAGMVKATLTATQLPGLYNVEWVDAEHEPLPDIGTWQFLGTDICRITFPTLNSTFRLHRIRH